MGDCRLVLSVRTARETRDTCQDSCAALPSSEHVSHRYRQGAHRVSHKYLEYKKYFLSLTFTSTLLFTHRAGEGSLSSEVKTEPRHDWGAPSSLLAGPGRLVCPHSWLWLSKWREADRRHRTTHHPVLHPANYVPHNSQPNIWLWLTVERSSKCFPRCPTNCQVTADLKWDKRSHYPDLPLQHTRPSKWTLHGAKARNSVKNKIDTAIKS